MSGPSFVVLDKSKPKTYALFSDRLKAQDYVEYLKDVRGVEAEWVAHSLDLFDCKGLDDWRKSKDETR